MYHFLSRADGEKTHFLWAIMCQSLTSSIFTFWCCMLVYLRVQKCRVVDLGFLFWWGSVFDQSFNQVIYNFNFGRRKSNVNLKRSDPEPEMFYEGRIRILFNSNRIWNPEKNTIKSHLTPLEKFKLLDILLLWLKYFRIFSSSKKCKEAYIFN